jgi:hypothetical protein
MPAKEEEVKKYRDAAIGNAAIVEEINTHHLDYTHHLDLKFPINRRRKGKFKSTRVNTRVRG